MKENFYLFDNYGIYEFLNKENEFFSHVNPLIPGDRYIADNGLITTSFLKPYLEVIKTNSITLKMKIYNFKRKKTNLKKGFAFLEVGKNRILRFHFNLADKIEDEYVTITLPKDLIVRVQEGANFKEKMRAEELKKYSY